MKTVDITLFRCFSHEQARKLCLSVILAAVGMMLFRSDLVIAFEGYNHSAKKAAELHRIFSLAHKESHAFAIEVYHSIYPTIVEKIVHESNDSPQFGIRSETLEKLAKISTYQEKESSYAPQLLSDLASIGLAHIAGDKMVAALLQDEKHRSQTLKDLELSASCHYSSCFSKDAFNTAIGFFDRIRALPDATDITSFEASEVEENHFETAKALAMEWLKSGDNYTVLEQLMKNEYSEALDSWRRFRKQIGEETSEISAHDAIRYHEKFWIDLLQGDSPLFLPHDWDNIFGKIGDQFDYSLLESGKAYRLILSEALRGALADRRDYLNDVEQKNKDFGLPAQRILDHFLGLLDSIKISDNELSADASGYTHINDLVRKRGEEQRLRRAEALRELFPELHQEIAAINAEIDNVLDGMSYDELPLDQRVEVDALFERRAVLEEQRTIDRERMEGRLDTLKKWLPRPQK